MRVTIYKLKFKSGFHLGDVGIGTESVRPTIPADTLFAALLTAWNRLGKNPAHWANAFPRTRDGTTENADPPFLLTSAFPYAKGTLFFPKPLGITLPDIPEEDRKLWKKVKFVSERLFFRLAKGNKLIGVWPKSDEQKEEQLRQGGTLLVLPDEEVPEQIWKVDKVPHVTLDRLTSASNLYSVGRVSFAEDSGLWFGIHWHNPESACGDEGAIADAFTRAFNELKASGLGGDRSAGQGAFEWKEMDKLMWDDPIPDTPAVLLSRYHPRYDEIPDVLRQAHAYALETVGGWSASSSRQFRRRRVTFLTEGSVIFPTGNKVMGDLIDVAPAFLDVGHPVWRYGLAFAVPLGGGA